MPWVWSLAGPPRIPGLALGGPGLLYGPPQPIGHSRGTLRSRPGNKVDSRDTPHPLNHKEREKSKGTKQKRMGRKINMFPVSNTGLPNDSSFISTAEFAASISQA